MMPPPFKAVEISANCSIVKSVSLGEESKNSSSSLMLVVYPYPVAAKIFSWYGTVVSVSLSPPSVDAALSSEALWTHAKSAAR